MTKKRQEIASIYKIAYHQDKLKAYLNHKKIYPVSLELDISSQCNRVCQDCPSSRGSKYWKLDLDFIENLFVLLSGKTKGLLLTGGEPTMSPIFPEVLKKARKYNFEEIAVVTNGFYLDEKKVVEALLKYASTIRISIYDWDVESCGGIEQILSKIERLRSNIDKNGSKMHIGVSVLTSEEKAGSLVSIGEKIKSAGGHWIYFHPTCTKWNQGRPEQVRQNGVLEKIQEYRRQNQDGFKVFLFDQRYNYNELSFSKYHAANFLLVVGADGKNYLGAEVKYQPKYELWDLQKNWNEVFFWHPERLNQIENINSHNYTAIRSRHRGVLYSQYIESLMTNEQHTFELSQNSDFLFPHIL